MNELDDSAIEKIVQRVLAELRPMIERPPQRFLTKSDAAKRSGLGEKSISRMIAAGKVTPLHPVRGRVLLEVNEFDSAILASDKRPRKGRGIR